MINVFYDEKDNQYYYIGVPLCSVCDKFINNSVFVFREITQKEYVISCKECIYQLKNKTRIIKGYEILYAIISTEGLSKDSRPVFPIPLSTQHSNQFCATIITDEEIQEDIKQGVMIENKCVYALTTQKPLLLLESEEKLRLSDQRLNKEIEPEDIKQYFLDYQK